MLHNTRPRPAVLLPAEARPPCRVPIATGRAHTVRTCPPLALCGAPSHANHLPHSPNSRPASRASAGPHPGGPAADAGSAAASTPSQHPLPPPESSTTTSPSTSSSTSTSTSIGVTASDAEGVVVILVEPKRGENIGAAARAMKNFGLRTLRLVRPSGGEWPNERARAVAARAVDLLDAAEVYDDLDAALADLQYVYATSGRPRDQDKLAKDVVMLRGLADALPPAGTRVGIMFGREDNGLYNDELVRANAILTIDTDPGFYSLNLGQAVLIVCYELFRAPQRPELGAKRQPASRREVESMLTRLFGALESRGFFTPYNADVLRFAIRGFFDRVAGLSTQDVGAVMQVLKALTRPPAPPAAKPSEPAAAAGDAAPAAATRGSGARAGGQQQRQ